MPPAGPSRRTTIILSHRVSTLQHADVILVLNEGRIVEQGTHAELLALASEYRRLHDRQAIEEPAVLRGGGVMARQDFHSEEALAKGYDRDVREYSQASLRRGIGFVLQDVFLFAGDVQSNIRLDHPLITPEQVEAAARAVGADRFIRALPGGYAAKVSEGGSTFSSGERQLIAFARALAFDPAILVLDEATAHVDSETEAVIQEALSRLCQGRTTLIVAHRLSTIQHADRIVVLHKGEIREAGTHAELLARQGLYYKLWRLQVEASTPPRQGTGMVPRDHAGAPLDV